MKLIKIFILLLVLTVPGLSANRYWVGGAGAWNNTALLKWSTTSGGVGGAAVPNSSDNVFFDAASGAITVTGGGTCLNLTTTGFIGTIPSNITIFGNITIGTGTIIPDNAGAFNMSATSGVQTITTNGVAFPEVVVNDNNTTQLLDNLITIQATGCSDCGLRVNAGSFDANGHNVTAIAVSVLSSLLMGSGTWTLTSNDVTAGQAVFSVFAGSTINGGTSTLKFTDTTSDIKTLSDNQGVTFNNIWITGNGTGIFYIQPVAVTTTFNNFKVDTPPHIVQFSAGNVVALSTWTVSGTPGNLITLQDDGGGGQFHINDSSGTNICNYCLIIKSNAGGGATWNATNSTNGGTNTGWNFISGPTNAQRGAGFFMPPNEL